MAKDIIISKEELVILEKAKALKEKERRYWQKQKLLMAKMTKALKNAGIEVTVTDEEVDEAIATMRT